MSVRTMLAVALFLAFLLAALVTLTGPGAPLGPRCPEVCVRTRQEPSTLLFTHDSVGGYFILPTTLVLCEEYVQVCPQDGGVK